jgi:uncharacterized membrane protein YkoI
MTRTKKLLTASAVLVALALGGAAIAGATGGGDDDAGEEAIRGSALARASAAALDHTGGGKVTGTEVGDEEGYYEVEVTRADGSEVDVHLDRDFQVLDSTTDRGDDEASGREDD